MRTKHDGHGVAFIGVESHFYDADNPDPQTAQYYGGADKFKLQTKAWSDTCDIFESFRDVRAKGADLSDYRTVVTMESIITDGLRECPLRVETFRQQLQPFYNSGGRVVIIIDVGIFTFAEKILSPIFNVSWKHSSWERSAFELTGVGADITGRVAGEQTDYHKGHNLHVPEEERLLLPVDDSTRRRGTPLERFFLPVEDFSTRRHGTPLAFHTDGSHGGQLVHVGLAHFICDEMLSRVVESVIRVPAPVLP